MLEEVCEFLHPDTQPEGIALFLVGKLELEGTQPLAPRTKNELKGDRLSGQICLVSPCSCLQKQTDFLERTYRLTVFIHE